MPSMSEGRQGEIVNFDRFAQVKDYTQLQFDDAGPTDIDGSMDFNGNAFIFIELKMEGALISDGQMKHLRLLVTHLNKPALAVVADHRVQDPKEPIPVHACPVTSFYTNVSKPNNAPGSFGWYSRPGETVLDIITRFKDRYGQAN